MIGLSDSQLEIIMSTAEPLAEENRQEFLERVVGRCQRLAAGDGTRRRGDRCGRSWRCGLRRI